MARRSEPGTALLAQDQALDAYFDALLQRTEPATLSAMPAVVAPASAPVVAPPPVEEAAVDGVPAWARLGFQCLLIHVGALRLAVPLVKLTRILPWGAHITATPGSPDGFVGLMDHEGMRTGVIDTARLVFPRDRRTQATFTVNESPSGHILLVEGGRWGLTCDRLGEVIDLKPEDVHWRSARTTRRWLAGTVIGQLCALLDVEALAQRMSESLTGLADNNEPR